MLPRAVISTARQLPYFWMSYSKQLYATVLRACTAAADTLTFDPTREFEQKWFSIVDTPVVRVRWMNEALEFLGDGVVNTCITTELCASVDGPPSMLSVSTSVCI